MQFHILLKKQTWQQRCVAALWRCDADLGLFQPSSKITIFEPDYCSVDFRIRPSH